MTRIWLIRHGEPVAEARNRCYGSLDVELSERGQEQSRHVAEFLRSEPLARVYSSPRSRALLGARLLGAAVEVIEDLREMGFGDFEGLPYDEIAARYPELYREWMERPAEVRFPNGESLAEMRVRVLRAFEAIRGRHDGETIAIVSHGGVNRIVLADALRIPDACIFSLAQDHGAINLVAYIDDFPIVQLMNQCKALRSQR